MSVYASLSCSGAKILILRCLYVCVCVCVGGGGGGGGGGWGLGVRGRGNGLFLFLINYFHSSHTGSIHDCMHTLYMQTQNSALTSYFKLSLARVAYGVFMKSEVS